VNFTTWVARINIVISFCDLNTLQAIMAQRLRQILWTTAGGATMGVATAVFSCSLAIGIEAAANKTLFTMFPHWYDDVTYAYGVNSQLLANSPAKVAERRKENEDADRLASWTC